MALSFTGAATDRVRTAAGSTTLDDRHTFTVIQWVYFTAMTLERALWYKTTGVATGKRVRHRASSGLIDFDVSRATTAGRAASTSGTVVQDVWTYIAFTYDESDGPRIFKGTLAATAAETGYAIRTVGTGSTTADGGAGFTIGNDCATPAATAFPGKIAFTAHYRRRFSLAEVQAYQFRPINDADCDGYFVLGWSGTGTAVPNWGSLGAADNGAITGCAVADHVPLVFPFKGHSGWRGAFTAAAAAGGWGPLMSTGRNRIVVAA